MHVESKEKKNKTNIEILTWSSMKTALLNRTPIAYQYITY